MKKKLFEVNILGTTYPIFQDNYRNDKFLEKNNGYIDCGKRYIMLDEEVGRVELKKHILIHEMVHAYLLESGLDDQTANFWAKNEEMIDWIALQLFKMSKTAYEIVDKFNKAMKKQEEKKEEEKK